MTGSETNGKSPGPEEDIEATELIDTKRIQAISEARMKADDAIEKYGCAKATGDLHREAANTAMLHSVRRYVRQLEGLLTSTQRGFEYWEQAEIGTWGVHPPDPGQLAWTHKVNNDMGVTDLDTPGEMPRNYELRNEAEFTAEELHLVGLKSIFEAPSVWEVKHTATFRVTHHNSDYTQTTVIKRAMPESIIETYFRAANRFAGEVGLDVHMKQEIDAHADPI
jgi:hypothetical protein